jgi:hypothetical protein
MNMENTSINHALDLIEKKSPRLVVHWASDLQTPAKFEWDDGAPATAADYDRYGASTYVHTMLAEGTLATIYDIDAVAFVRFDAALGRWVCTQGRNMIVLDVDDPQATDADIQSEIGMYDRATGRLFSALGRIQGTTCAGRRASTARFLRRRKRQYCFQQAIQTG